MVISELIRRITSMLVTDNPHFEAELIVMETASLTRTGLIINGRAEAKEETIRKSFEMAARRNAGEPVQYIIGSQEFMSLEFEVNRDTLIPRQDTETLVEYIIGKAQKKPVRILDIGTGSGCIGISLAYYLKDAEAVLLDINRAAIETARRNAQKNKVKAEFAVMNIMEEYPDGRFDIIVSNPPYIETGIIDTLQKEVRDYEPTAALDGGADGLDFYRRICGIAPYMLNEGGRLAFEIGYDQGQAVSGLMSENGFEKVETIKDPCGNDRVVSGAIRGR